MNANGYSYRASTKSDLSDELINTYAIRPLAGLIVRAVFPTSITPNHITVAAIAVGFLSAGLYAIGSPAAFLCAGLALTVKDVLDSADGQLARAKQSYSRAGRFLDSIGDIAVNLAVFAAIGWSLSSGGKHPIIFAPTLAAFLSLTLRVSYHVFYQASFLHLHDAYGTNRISEELTPADLQSGPATLTLQRIFQFLYGWQDRLMGRLDRWSRDGCHASDAEWFGNIPALRWSGAFGLGTELLLLTICSIFNALPVYLWINLVGGNLLWAGCVVYRRRMLRGNSSGTKAELQ